MPQLSSACKLGSNNCESPQSKKKRMNGLVFNKTDQGAEIVKLVQQCYNFGVFFYILFYISFLLIFIITVWSIWFFLRISLFLSKSKIFL